MTSIGIACAKFILIGEHFVLSGSPALAFPIPDFYTKVELSVNSKAEVSDMSAIKAVKKAYEILERPLPENLRIKTSSNFPQSRGFGSSASFSLAIFRAIEKQEGLSLASKKIAWSIKELEKLYHGSPSGLDTETVRIGTPILFQNGNVVRSLKNQAVDFVILDTGERLGCAKLIQEVKSWKEQNKTEWESLLTKTTKFAFELESALEQGKAEIVANAVNSSQEILKKLGLSNPLIDEIIEKALGFGGLAGKVSGAGGGGALILVTPRGEGNKLAQRLKREDLKGASVLTVVEVCR